MATLTMKGIGALKGPRVGYKKLERMHCERCVFGRGEHAEFCELRELRHDPDPRVCPSRCETWQAAGYCNHLKAAAEARTRA